jgi:hypothetical protein
VFELKYDRGIGIKTYYVFVADSELSNLAVNPQQAALGFEGGFLFSY